MLPLLTSALANCNQRYDLLLKADVIGDIRIDDRWERDLDTSEGRMRAVYTAEVVAYALFLTGTNDARNALIRNSRNPAYGESLVEYADAIQRSRKGFPPERLDGILSRIP